MKRFEAECAFMKDIGHPNIIRYLGMSIDPETGLPVLLMELMDESLTHFLEKSVNPIPDCIVVNICLDVARALSYLHSNDIIHRDLSSNNILLDGKHTAKLTDFGMAKFLDITMTDISNTTCPGTTPYMPPESLAGNKAVYTAKGDIFSLGVVIIQILTRKFPDPGERFKTVKINDPEVEYNSAKVEVREIKRRDNHIREIPPAHPILPIAFVCLKDQEDARPSAKQVYEKLAPLKDTQECISTESVKQIQQKSMPQQVRAEARDHATVKRDLKSLNWKSGGDAPDLMCRDTDAVVSGTVAYFRPYDLLNMTKFIFAFDSSNGTWSEQPDCPAEHTTLAIVKGLLTTVGGKRSNKLFSLTGTSGAAAQGNLGWTEVFPPMITKRHNVTAVSTDTALIAAGGEAYGRIRDTTLKMIEVMKTDTLQWCQAADLPKPMYRASATICGDRIYFLGGSKTFFSDWNGSLTCSLSALIQSNLTQQHGLWSEIAKLPVMLSTCVTFHDHLLAIGGEDLSRTSTTAVHMFDPVNNSWKVISHLISPRNLCFVVALPDDRLMVAGGKMGSAETNTVEFATVV